MFPRQRAMTLIETAIALGVVGLLGLLATGVSGNLAEESRTAKCQSNLKQMITAIHEYAADFEGKLPGPVHPAIRRGMHDQTGAAYPTWDRQKSLAWLLRPYFPPKGPADVDPELADPVMDEVLRCPTAGLVTPDERFRDVAAQQTGCWRERPYSYVMNSIGPTSPTSTVNTGMWAQTDPPHYFGVWYLCDPQPQLQTGVSWCPVRLSEVRNAAAEWATADAWFRRVGADGGSSRPPSPPARPWLGTIGLDSGPNATRSVIPSAPYHRTSLASAQSHFDLNTAILPRIAFTGTTNLAFFDGHVAPFQGSWQSAGEGGTVNPYWSMFGGTHSAGQYSPRTCVVYPPNPD